MPFQKGNTYGNRRGRPKRGAALTEFIRAELDKPYRPDTKTTNKERIAQVVVKAACMGDLTAVAWITQRLEGNVKQGIDLSGEVIHQHDVTVRAVDYRASIRALRPVEGDERSLPA